jgi:hypothetical protein
MNLDEAKTKTKNFFKKLMWLSVAVLILFSISWYFYRNYTLSEGTRSGMLFKISKKGKIFKTYEGELHLAGSAIMNKESVWKFSAIDASVYNQLQQYEGKNVKLHYKEIVDAFPWQGDTDYLVYSVDEVK